MLDYIEYQKSISNELIAVKDRVYNIIGDKHWGEVGRYKEIILSDVIKRHLPSGVSIGNGFIVNGDKVSTQIDILIYKSYMPILFKKDEFVIVPAESVLGVIEVKSSLNTTQATEAILKASKVRNLIRRDVFNGVFSYINNTKTSDSEISYAIDDALIQSHGKVNYLCFGKDAFAVYWKDKTPKIYNHRDKYHLYHIEDLAFGYFISNLLEEVYIAETGNPLPENVVKSFYPIRGGKEQNVIRKVYCEEYING